MRKSSTLFMVVFVGAALMGWGCFGGGGDDGSYSSGDCAGGDWCGENAITVTADIGDAEALFIQNESGSVLGSVSAEKAITVSSESPLYAVTNSGITNILSALYSGDSTDASEGLPKLSFVAVSPIGHVVLVFEHSFIYTETAADGTLLSEYSDPWSPSSPFTCQIFAVNRKINEATAGEQPGLTCITNELEINTWDSQAAMIQFDGTGNVYFSAHVPQNWKNVLLKWSPGSDGSVENGTLSEVINANICFREFTVTNEGGVLYTGITSTSGDCNGTSFLRYKTPTGELQEITSGWWDYVFKPIESTDFASANISASISVDNVGQILFYGPDPEVATSPEWDDSCLFKFNPDADGNLRSVAIADCDIDIWRYVDWADTLTEKKSRCTKTKNMMGGGNVPEKIMLADFNEDGAEYEIYVVGQIYEKLAGEWRCDLCINSNTFAGNYCVANGNLHFEATDLDTCTAVDDDEDGTPDGGSWATQRDCFNQQVNSTSTGSICDTTDANFDINGQWCEQPGGEWRETYNALSWVIYDDNDTPDDEDDDIKQIVRFSENNEIVKNGWVINNSIVYSSFTTSGDDAGDYKLKKAVWTDANANGLVDTTDADVDGIPDEVTVTELISGIEVYELFADPRSTHTGEWFFNGLRFSDNQYITGTFDPTADDPSATLTTEADITGQIETLVIVPNL